MVLHPFCSRIICELPPLVEAHQQLPTRRLAVDVVIIQYALQCTCLWTVLDSIHTCLQKHRHACPQSQKRGCKVQIKHKGPWMCRKKVLKEEKYKQKIFWVNEDEKEHSFHGNREGYVWNWQLVNAQPYNAHTCFCHLGGCNIDLHSVLWGLP